MPRPINFLAQTARFQKGIVQVRVDSLGTLPPPSTSTPTAPVRGINPAPWGEGIERNPWGRGINPRRARFWK